MDDYYILDDAGHVPIRVERDDYLKAFTARGASIDSTGVDPNRVDRTEVGEAVVSTVFLNHDHSFGFGPPVLWETMTFGPEPWDGQCWRYASRAEAEAGHAVVVRVLVAGGKPEDVTE